MRATTDVERREIRMGRGRGSDRADGGMRRDASHATPNMAHNLRDGTARHRPMQGKTDIGAEPAGRSLPAGSPVSSTHRSRAAVARAPAVRYFFAAPWKSFKYSPYPWAARSFTGMKRMDAEFMQ